uniref:CDP-glycerol glycerophosphotransferase family protein n=1 Tax=Listeria monocytogenes TaxID=1639 RepID=UPI0019696B21
FFLCRGPGVVFKRRVLWSGNPKFVAVFEDYGSPYHKRCSHSCVFKMGLAKYWISNSRLPLELPKPKKKNDVQTWHGTPLKQSLIHISEHSRQAE